jgi:DNA-binding transcriptional LysR family regulator
LTPAGTELYGAARRLLRTADSVQALIKSPSPVAPVRIASSPTIAELRLPQVLGELNSREHPLTAELISANSGVVRELVNEGRADLGVAGLDPYELYTDGLEERVVWRDELVLAVPDSHPWAELREVPAEEFAATPVLQRDPWSNSSRVVTTALDRLGLERARAVPVIGSAASVIAAARASGTPALVSLLAVRANPEALVEIRRVEGLRFGLEYGLVWAGSIHDLRPEVQVVADHILKLPYSRSRAL